MLVNLKISQWSARKHDPNASREVETNHNAQNAGRFNKLLIADEELKKVQKIANSIRQFHYYNTLPWGDNGDRMLPSKNYLSYMGEFGKMKSDFEQTVQNFIAKYSDLILDAQNRLGTLFNSTDYPKGSEIEEKFRVRVSVMPIETSDDFRVSLSEEEADKIRKDINAEINNRVQGSINDMVERVREAVRHMKNKLSDPDAVFRDSLVTNICNLIDILPKLNFANNEKITNLVADIKPLCADPERLRTEPKYRSELAERANIILVNMD